MALPQTRGVANIATHELSNSVKLCASKARVDN